MSTPQSNKPVAEPSVAPSIDRLALLQLARLVCSAYGAYNDAINNSTVDPIQFTQFIKARQPTLTNIQPIYVYEKTPNDPTGTSVKSELHDEALGAHDAHQSKKHQTKLPQAPEVPECFMPSTKTIIEGKQLFGYTATAPASMNLGKTEANILVLRGTVTKRESELSAIGWDTLTACTLPTEAPGKPTVDYGKVKNSYFGFYSWVPLDKKEISLARSLKDAVKATMAVRPSLPWYAAAHSLGGAMLDIGLMDLMAEGTLTAFSSPTVATFGSVAVGDFLWAKGNRWIPGYDNLIPNTFRVANLCDFVPSIRAVLGTEPAVDLYQHVGYPYLFVWQKDADWKNHSLANVYIAFLSDPNNYLNIWDAKNSYAPPLYPVGIQKFGIQG